MSEIITSPQNYKDSAIMVTDENEHEYEQPRDVNPLMETALMATVHCSDPIKRKNIVVAMGLTEEEGQAQRDIGVFEADIGPFHTVVNWTPTMKGKIPPCHILVSYSDTEVGLLSPYLDDLPVDGFRQVNEWWGELKCGIHISEIDLWEACTQAIPRATGKDRHFSDFDGDVVDEIKASGE